MLFRDDASRNTQRIASIGASAWLSARPSVGRVMLATLCLSGLAGLLIAGSLTDIEYRRLPNWLTSAVAALYCFFVATSPTPVDWISACVVASLVFGVGLATFSFQLLGGGDVKLMTGLALWAGPDLLPLFLIVTSIAGGCLAGFTIAVRQIKRSNFVFYYPLFDFITRKFYKSMVTTATSSSSTSEQSELADSLPYGVAIAAGGFAVIYVLQQL